MFDINKVKHVKWAMPKTNNPKAISYELHSRMGINTVDIAESTINDLDGNVIMGIWVLEFDAPLYKVAALKTALKLEEVNGYLM